jgi:hypothetical protein
MGAPASYTYVILVSGVNNTSEEIKAVSYSFHIHFVWVHEHH